MDRQSCSTFELISGIYFCFFSLAAIIAAVTFLVVVFGSVRAAVRLHQNLLANILRVPQLFFDRTPTGRIMNRFSKDIDTIDWPLIDKFRSFLWNFFEILKSIVIISMTTPIFLSVCVPIGVLYMLSQV